MKKLEQIAVYLMMNGFTSDDKAKLIELYEDDLTKEEIFGILDLIADYEKLERSVG